MINKLNTVIVGNQSVTPSKIVCIGRNYVEHIQELDNEIPDQMVVFMKSNSAISEVLSSVSEEPLHYEAEICFMIHQGQFSAVGFGLDITKRNLQNSLKSKGLPWERAKAFNGSAVFSPFVEIPEIDQTLSLKLEINAKKTQSGNIRLMIHKPEDILIELKTFLDLNDGDIIMTGTPKGVGAIHKGDIFEGYIKTNMGILTHAKWTAN